MSHSEVGLLGAGHALANRSPPPNCLHLDRADQRLPRSTPLLALLTACLLVALACGDESNLGRSFEQRVQATLPGDEFRLEEVTDFSWERCALLRPYTTGARAKELLRSRWPNFAALGLESRDSFHVLACSQDGKVIDWGRIGREIEFTKPSTDRPLLPGARFRIIETIPRYLVEIMVRSDTPTVLEPED